MADGDVTCRPVADDQRDVFASLSCALNDALEIAANLVRHVRVTRAPRTALVQFDRDGTLIEDVVDLHVADVRPVRSAREALDRLRSAGIPAGIVTNQAGVGEGRVSPEDPAAVHARIEAELGPFCVWAICEHPVSAECSCGKPKPLLIIRAARERGVAPARCVVVGDIGSDIDAASAAGSGAILVPNAITLAREIDRVPRVARDLSSAVDMIIAGMA